MDFARIVVLDNGTGVIKAGFGGEDMPKCLLQNIVGRPKHPAVMPGGAIQGDTTVGEAVDHHRGVLRLSYPMEHGHVTNWSDMEAVWNHLFGMLDVSIKEHPVLLTEAPLNSHENKEKAAEIFFEQYQTPALFFSVQAVLSLYAAGTTTGVVVDVGDGVTHVCPVYEGFVIPGAVGRSDVAGRDVTRQLQLQLRQRGYNFTTSAELEIVRQIKEQQCYVAYMPTKEEDLVRTKKFDRSEYRLPDGGKLQLAAERFRPPEVLFDPKLIGSEEMGVAQLLSHSLKKCDIDVRKNLFTKMFISGGSTLFKGFGDRLLSETRRSLPREVMCKLHAPPERKYTTWLGGAILADLTAFRKMMITAETYKVTMSGNAIDLDAIDIDEIAPEKKRRRCPDSAEKKAKQAKTKDEDDYDRRIQERMKRLRDKSLSPERERKPIESHPVREDEQKNAPRQPPPERSAPVLQADKDDFEDTPNESDLMKSSLCFSERDEAAFEELKKSGKPMTKIQIQLEKARMHKERAKKQAKEDAGLNPKKRFGARAREYQMMRSTVTHWSDKTLSKMTERDWRILREDFEIQVLGSGATCPLPMRNWAEGYREGVLSPMVMEAINTAGYRDPSPVQMACIPVGIKRLDLIGLAETGSGKTCAFVVPLVTYVSEQPPMTEANREHGPYAVIMCPSRELANQIEDECCKFSQPFGFRTISVVGGVKHEQQGHEIRKGVEIVVGTPGRLCDLIERHYLVFNQCNYVVLDEADSMVREGMEEQVVTVFENMPSSNDKPAEADDEEIGKTYRVTVMFSSTMAHELEGIAKRHLRRPVIIKVGLSSPSDIKQTVIVMDEAKDKRARCLQMLKEILAGVSSPLIMVFCNMRTEVESLGNYLDEEGVSSRIMHGGLSQGLREAAMQDFHDRKYLVLIATDIVGRGIDVKGVTHVFNYDCPVGENPIDKYSQRIGRTGRQGMKGEAVTFLVTKTDTDIMYDLKKKLESEGQVVPKELAMQEAAKIAPGQLANRKKRETVIHARTF